MKCSTILKRLAMQCKLLEHEVLLLVYVPLDLSLDVTFFALSLGTVCPQFVHCTTPDDPFPPLVRPLLARLSGMTKYGFASLYSCVI